MVTSLNDITTVITNYLGEQIAPLNVQISNLQGTIAALQTTIDRLQAQLDALQSAKPILGLAVPGGDPEGFKAAADAGLNFDVVRLYATSIPTKLANWSDAAAQAALGKRLWLSIAVSVTKLANGDYDAALAAFVKTLPAGTILTTNHEPSNKAKGISPLAFAAAWNHAARVILDASAGTVIPAPIEIQANVVKQGYLNGLTPELVKIVGLDGYDGITGSAGATRNFSDIVNASVTYTRNLFPNAQIGFAEFNTSRTTGRPQWIADTLTWAKSQNMLTMVLFTSLDFWQMSTAELTELAGLLRGH